MSQLFTIENDKIVINKLALTETEGNVTHTGDITVVGTLTVDNLVVNNEAQAKPAASVGAWTSNDESGLLGQGLSWTWGEGSVQLSYMTGNRLWSNSDVDLDGDKSYMIDNTPVLSRNELGGAITKSKLREVGTLRTLNVSGDTALAEFAFFNSSLNRLGLNTDTPNATFSIVDNNVEFVVGSSRENAAQFGSFTNHDVEILTDNIARIEIKNSGEVTLNSDVTIKGTLTVDTVVTDSRIDRFSPLEFKTSRDRAIYGLGMIWTGTNDTRQLIMMAEPDRLWTTESLDLAADRSYHINGVPVLSSNGLGNNVTQSNLSKLGTLEFLNVAGEATFMDRINASRAIINAKNIEFNDNGNFTITNSLLSAESKISVKVAHAEVFYADTNEINIGNSGDKRRPVKVFGQLSVGVNNPDPELSLAVSGPISFSDKKFVTGSGVPTQGSFNKGDICWNDNPTVDNYVGWVCIETGAPGQWLPFGAIARQ